MLAWNLKYSDEKLSLGVKLLNCQSQGQEGWWEVTSLWLASGPLWLRQWLSWLSCKQESLLLHVKKHNQLNSKFYFTPESSNLKKQTLEIMWTTNWQSRSWGNDRNWIQLEWMPIKVIFRNVFMNQIFAVDLTEVIRGEKFKDRKHRKGQTYLLEVSGYFVWDHSATQPKTPDLAAKKTWESRLFPFSSGLIPTHFHPYLSGLANSGTHPTLPPRNMLFSIIQLF